jgi:HEAT repeat protein
VKWQAVLVAITTGLLAGGCGGAKNADDWIKTQFTPPTTEGSAMRLKSERPDERREALHVVAADRSARAIPTMVQVFCLEARSDTDPMVRSAAVQGLRFMEGPEVVPSLVLVAAKDGSPYVRADAVAALGLKVEGAAALMQVLQADRAADVRVAAAEALRNFKDKAAAQALVAAMADSSLAVALKAWESLRYMTGHDLPREAKPWEEFLADAADPFASYGKPPPMPKGQNQRGTFTKGPVDFIRGLFAKDPNEAELE